MATKKTIADHVRAMSTPALRKLLARVLRDEGGKRSVWPSLYEDAGTRAGIGAQLRTADRARLELYAREGLTLYGGKCFSGRKVARKKVKGVHRVKGKHAQGVARKRARGRPLKRKTRGRHALRARLKRATAPALPTHAVVEDYAARRDAKLERRKARVIRLQGEAAGAFARRREMHERIPMGQPILVGHHSEKRHRNDIKRMDRLLEKGVEAHRESERLACTVARTEAGYGGISSDDPEAVTLLRAKLAESERQHAQILAANAELKKGASARDVAHYFDWWQDPANRIDIWRSLGHKTIPTANSSAEMRRIKERIAGLEHRRAEPARASEQIGAVLIDEDQNRVRLHFPGKPDEATRTALKGAGFRWSPREGTWQRMTSSQAWYQARRIAGAT